MANGKKAIASPMAAPMIAPRLIRFMPLILPALGYTTDITAWLGAQAVLELTDWLPPAVVGVSFTLLGLVKIYGFARGIVGGGGKPASQRLCGSCPSWSRGANYAMALLFLVIGLGNLAYVAWIVAHART